MTSFNLRNAHCASSGPGSSPGATDPISIKASRTRSEALYVRGGSPPGGGVIGIRLPYSAPDAVLCHTHESRVLRHHHSRHLPREPLRWPEGDIASLP